MGSSKALVSLAAVIIDTCQSQCVVDAVRVRLLFCSRLTIRFVDAELGQANKMCGCGSVVK